MVMTDNQDQPFDLGPALARIGNIPTQDQLGQAAQDEGAAYRGRLAQEQPQAPENPTFNGAMIEPITPLSPQSQPPYDYSAANLESGRNLSRQSFVDSYNKQAAAEPRVDPLNRIASALAGRPVSPYNANPSNYRQLTPSEEAEKYRSEQSEYAGLAAGIATPELASATGLARFAPGPNQLNMFLPARDFQMAEANRMEQSGLHPKTILKQTGAFRDVDGRWMREISDASSRVTPEAQQFIKDYQSSAGPATDIFEHPELYKQAPGLKKYEMELEQEPEFITQSHPDYFPGFEKKAEAMEQMGRSPSDIFAQSNMRRTPTGEWEQRYFPLGWHNGAEQNIRIAGANPEDFRKTALHEMTHAVDRGMGRPNYGASDDRIYGELAKLPPEDVIARANASRLAGSPWAPNPASYEGNWEGFLRQQASDEYMRNAGEARARNVETRRNMSPAERLNTHPFKTMDVPPEQQIVGSETTPGSSQLSVPSQNSPGFTLYHGSPHDYPAERLVQHPSGETEHIVGSPGQLPEVPEGATVLQDYPLGRVRLDKVGTGEGAQAYSHGWYGAEREGIAGDYRKKLGYKDAVQQFRNHLPDDASFEEINELVDAGKVPPKMGRVLQALKQDDWLGFDYPSQAISQAFRPSLHNFDPSPELVDAVKNYGHMYETRVNADPEHFIDWDKPLSEQSEHVKNALKNTQWGRSQLDLMGSSVEPKGSHLAPRTPDQAAEMAKIGIPGTKYLDAASRNLPKEQATRNFVLHDERIAAIVRKYGIPGAIAMGAITPEMGRQMQEQGLASGGRVHEFKHSGSVSDKTYALLHRIKRITKNTDRLGPGGFETQVVPAHARGGTASDKTNTLLAKLKAQKSA